MQLKGTVAVRSLWRSERTDAGDVLCVFQIAITVSSEVALTRCVGSVRVGSGPPGSGCHGSI